jgi:Guanylate kinase
VGTVYIFRGKAAVGKTTLSNMLAVKLSIPVIRKDDVVDALKTTNGIDKSLINNEVYYNILHKLIQTNLDLGTDLILDLALGDRKNAKCFFDRLDFRNNNVLWFFITCSDVNEWERRHMKRLKKPKPNQTFDSFSSVIEHYKNADLNPFEYEHVIDSVDKLEKCFETITQIAEINRIKQE